MKPEISVLIPSYNYAHYLHFAIESMIAQTFTNWEAIIIDDGSKDETQEVVAQFDDPRIRYIYQDNKGLSAARNTGLREANSEIIALLDADDIWQDDYLAQMIVPLRDQPDVIAVYCGFQYINQDGEEVGVPNLTTVPPEEFREHYSKYGNWLVPSGVVFRKNIAEKEGCFDESLKAVEDSDLWSKMSRHGLFVGLPLPLVGYRRHDANMSSDPQRIVSANYIILERYYGPPEGDASIWKGNKKRAYTRYFRSAAIRYLAFQDVQMSAYLFLRMVDITPQSGSEIGVWRSLARVHLPIELRDSPNVIDWESAQKDVTSLLAELEKMRADSNTLDERFALISGNAYLALADEAFRARNYPIAFQWLSRALICDTSLLTTRPFWGTLARGISFVL